MIQDMQKNFEIQKIKRSAFKAKKVHSHPFHERFFILPAVNVRHLSATIYTNSTTEIL